MTPSILWSLWDMLELKAAPFVQVIKSLEQLIQINHHAGFDKEQVLAQQSRDVSNQLLDHLATYVSVLAIPVTTLALSDARSELENNSQLTYAAFGQVVRELSKTITRELTTKKIYVLDHDKARFYEPKEPLFGPIVSTQFPSIASEVRQIEECYACNLSTASAFHAIRCLEAGMRAVAKCLSIPDPIKSSDRNWGVALGKIKEQVQNRWPNATTRMSGEGQTFDEIYGSLSGIQNPYRNTTMHLEANYDGPEALYLYNVVKGLMIKIASRMDENGEPKV